MFNTTNANLSNTNLTNATTMIGGNNSAITEQINTVLSCYVPGSPNYKFSYWFYNLSNTPVVRPADMGMEQWNELYINQHLMPVKLNCEQIRTRREQQNDLTIKLNNTKQDTLEQIGGLNSKKNTIRNKLKTLVYKFRKVAKGFIRQNEHIYMNTDTDGMIKREKLYLADQEEGILQMEEIKERLNDLLKRIKKDERGSLFE
ncbi:hypothetical protein ECANGB1_944 [Enterospora canceri]|uniref:Uncharacterized protein n=1 Tax=Enterospora canceri TaxID=1081671 RepID=A0A1Y1S776_9MICR|nr:hypothetical protein ECANGB1_944 [Enterospora canceri]